MPDRACPPEGIHAEQIAAAETEVLKPEKTFYSVVENEGEGELNDDTFAIIAENGRGADSFIIAAQSTVFDTAAQNSRGIFFMGIGKEISEADISDEESVIEKMQTAADRLAAERTMRSVEKYEQVRDSVLSEFAEFEANAEEELPYKERFYKAITDYLARGGGNLLDEAQIEKLTGDKGNILARLYDYDWDGVAHDLSDDAEITVLIEYYNENKVSENAGTADNDYAAIVRERWKRRMNRIKKRIPTMPIISEETFSIGICTNICNLPTLCRMRISLQWRKTEMK